MRPDWQCDVHWVLGELRWTPEYALVAGGRALQMLFPLYPTKDTDVFLITPGGLRDRAREWLKENATLVRWGQGAGDKSSFDPTWPDALVVNHGNWVIPERKLDLVFVSAPSHAAILGNFDIGVCQVGWQPDDGTLVLTERALRDITAHEITSYRMQYADRTNHRERLKKYSERMGWPIRVEKGA